MIGYEFNTEMLSICIRFNVHDGLLAPIRRFLD